jgi:hypothetical protein
LNPSGFVLVDHERHHCESQGMIVDSQVDVEIIAVEGTRLVVKVVKTPAPEPPGEDETPASSGDSVTDGSLDFEVPET